MINILTKPVRNFKTKKQLWGNILNRAKDVSFKSESIRRCKSSIDKEVLFLDWQESINDLYRLLEEYNKLQGNENEH